MLVAIAHQSLRRPRKTLPADDLSVAATQPAVVADV
jgi:hypothetical protein